jgi:hypothetical protein
MESLRRIIQDKRRCFEVYKNLGLKEGNNAQELQTL